MNELTLKDLRSAIKFAEETQHQYFDGSRCIALPPELIVKLSESGDIKANEKGVAMFYGAVVKPLIRSAEDAAWVKRCDKGADHDL